MNGILNINKPEGETSFGVVAMVKRLTGERRVGHAGTLDPMATGVLPVCLGQATRITQFLTGATKHYRAEMELGVTTDTYDASGKVIERKDASLISQEQVVSALTSFVGEIQQVPPMYSALKHHGRRLYELARQGTTVERRPRTARVSSLQLTDWKPPVATAEVVCGKGTYIRSLAHDLGQALGCGATLKSLVRLRCGPFELADAISASQLEEAVGYGYWRCLLHPVDSALLHQTAIVVGDTVGNMIRNGRPVAMGNDSVAVPAGYRCRAYTGDGHFLGVLLFNQETGQWQPEKVFSIAYPEDSLPDSC